MANVIKKRNFSILRAIKKAGEVVFYGFRELGANNEAEDISLEKEVAKIREQEHKGAIANLEKQISPKFKKAKVSKSELKEYRRIETNNKEINKENRELER